MTRKTKDMVSLCLVTLLITSLFSVSVFSYEHETRSALPSVNFEENALLDKAPLSGDDVVVERFEISELTSIEEYLQLAASDFIATDTFKECEYEFELSESQPAELEFVFNDDINQEDIEPYLSDTTTASILSAESADVFVTNLSTSSTGTLTINTLHTFSFEVGNYGPSVANSVNCMVYLDNVLTGTIAVGTLQSGTGFIYTFKFGLNGGSPGGKHMLKIIASSSAPDPNAANNTEVRSFTWEEKVDLNVHSLTNLTSGNYEAFATFIPQGTTGWTPNTQEMKVSVSNLGSVACTRFALNIFANDDLIYNSSIATKIDPGYMLSLTWNVASSKSGRLP